MKFSVFIKWPYYNSSLYLWSHFYGRFNCIYFQFLLLGMFFRRVFIFKKILAMPHSLWHLFSNQGLNLGPHQETCRALTTGLPGTSQDSLQLKLCVCVLCSVMCSKDFCPLFVYLFFATLNSFWLCWVSAARWNRALSRIPCAIQ